MCMVFASGVLQAQPGVVYTSDQPDRRAGGTGQPVVVYTGEQLDPLSDRYCPYCVFKVREAEREARTHGVSQPVVVYTGEQLDPRSDRYCPYCVFKVQEAERAARERRLKAAATGALLRFDSLRERRNRD